MTYKEKIRRVFEMMNSIEKELDEIKEGLERDLKKANEVVAKLEGLARSREEQVKV